MANLIVPDKDKHKYVVGIDFGHGETSAAVCPIDLSEDTNQHKLYVEDIELDRTARKKKIASAICYVNNGQRIGDEALEHIAKNSGIRIGFKQKPVSLEGEAERLMIDFMKAVYGRIRESRSELTDTNHIVYISRPTGWSDEASKELYRQMAFQAGVPLGGLISELDAAVFYAKTLNATELSIGAILLDMDSSTLDLTYLSDTVKPIAYRYNIGASIIDNTVYEQMVLKDRNVSGFVKEYPKYMDNLNNAIEDFKAKRIAGKKVTGVFLMTDAPMMNRIRQAIANEFNILSENIMIGNEIAQSIALHGALDATMAIVAAQIKDSLPNLFKTDEEVCNAQKKLSADISTRVRNIVDLAHRLMPKFGKQKEDKEAFQVAKESVQTALVAKEEKAHADLFSGKDVLNRFRNALSDSIAKDAWAAIDSASRQWVKSGKGIVNTELKANILNEFEVYRKERLPAVIKGTLNEFLSELTVDIQREMNVIISRYIPGQEICLNGEIGHENILAISDSLSKSFQTVYDICISITNTIEDFVMTAKDKVLLLRSDELKRQDKADIVLAKKDEIINKIRSKFKDDLSRNTAFNDSLSVALNDYFTKLIDANIAQVVIPIE